jgi:hypothetical protein
MGGLREILAGSRASAPQITIESRETEIFILLIPQTKRAARAGKPLARR